MALLRSHAPHHSQFNRYRPLADAQLDQTLLIRRLQEIATWVYRESGIEVPVDQARVQVFQNRRGRLAAEARIYYSGPLQPRGSLPRIKLDLTADERVVLDAVVLPISHPYRDQPPEGISVRCYPYAEVFAEKIRALGDRARPRDLYDVVNLHRRDDALEAAANVREVLVQKCAFKGIPVPTLAALEPARDELSADWDHMLAHQLPYLPPFESFWDALPSFFAWLERGVRPAQLAPYELAAGEQVIRPAVGTLSALGMPRTSPFERIRFAAASHLCVDLDYTTLDGRRSRRLIEPYSLRRSQDGNVVLHALRADSGGHRSYRVELINGASVTSQIFIPKYAIELSPESPLLAPHTSHRPAPPSVSRRPRATRAVVGYEPQYIYECALCRRTFRRRHADSRLRAHNDQNGRPCFGRSGLYRSGP